MKLLSGEGLRKDILESYFKNHKEWSFVISPSLEHGFYDAIVSGPDGAWMLKIDSLFKPVPIVIGSPVEAKPRSKSENPFPYGYRKVSRELVLRTLGGEGYPPSDKRSASFLSLLRSETVVPEGGGHYAEGPFVLTSSRKDVYPRNRRKLMTNLRRRCTGFLRPDILPTAERRTGPHVCHHFFGLGIFLDCNDTV